MTIPENIIKIHEDLVEFSSKVQEASVRKMDKESHIKANVYAVFYKIIAYAVGYSGETGHSFRFKTATDRSEATLDGHYTSLRPE